MQNMPQKTERYISRISTKTRLFAFCGVLPPFSVCPLLLQVPDLQKAASASLLVRILSSSSLSYCFFPFVLGSALQVCGYYTVSFTEPYKPFSLFFSPKRQNSHSLPKFYAQQSHTPFPAADRTHRTAPRNAWGTAPSPRPFS